MSSAEPGMQEIERRFVAWADSDARIRAAFVMGSRARTDHPADVWSDLDIVAISAESEHLLNDTEWLAHLGTPLLTFVEPTAVGVGRERRVLFAGGHDVDIAIFSVGQFDHLHPAVIHAVARRGLRVLLDKDRYLARLHVIEAELLAASSSPPASAEWLAVCNNFWYHVLWTVRKRRRGERFVSKECCDRHMKDLLGQMIVWHVGATRNWSLRYVASQAVSRGMGRSAYPQGADAGLRALRPTGHRACLMGNHESIRLGGARPRVTCDTPTRPTQKSTSSLW